MLIGLAILGGVLVTDWGGAPTCGGTTMTQGDVCHKLSDTDGSSDKTYDEQKSDEKSAPYIWGTLGGILLLAGAISWPIRRRAAPRAAAATAATAATPTAATPTGAGTTPTATA